MTEPNKVEKRIRWASFMIAGGLLVQVFSLTRIHPLFFVAFLLIGCPLVGLGILLYLISLVTAESAQSE